MIPEHYFKIFYAIALAEIIKKLVISDGMKN
jgi:hypothetical protein